MPWPFSRKNKDSKPALPFTDEQVKQHVNYWETRSDADHYIGNIGEELKKL